MSPSGYLAIADIYKGAKSKVFIKIVFSKNLNFQESYQPLFESFFTWLQRNKGFEAYTAEQIATKVVYPDTSHFIIGVTLSFLGHSDNQALKNKSDFDLI